MKTCRLLLFATSLLLSASCVQKADLKTVIVTMTVKGKKDIASVGIRGEGKPLSWNKDYPMKEQIKDSVYTASFQVLTAFRYAEYKFTADGVWELKDQPNRKVEFLPGKDTVRINAVFDQE